MRFLILSDLHANWEALEAVLGHADGHYDRILCCGDIVGYGADPNAVTEWVRQQVPIVVRGNHDKAAVGLADLEEFNPAARASALWTQQALSPENLAYLRDLPRGPVALDGMQEEFHMVHGSPLDEDEYVVGTGDAWLVAPYLDVSIVFFGHTHLQGGFVCHRNGIRKIGVHSIEHMGHVLELEPDTNYLLNPGSVGQPRDGDPRAAYLIYQQEGRLIEYYRVTYDIPKAQRKIIDAGLPDKLAYRLDFGQ